SFQGTASWTNFGLGSCGWINSNSEMVTGVSPGAMSDKTKCGACAIVTGDSGQIGKSVKVKIVDTCMGCGDSDLNLSCTVFEALGYSTDVGHVQVSWQF
ncbi:hypothetical protein GQ42DRAFT_113724, partial [Ramicandelaber brevisporus]